MGRWQANTPLQLVATGVRSPPLCCNCGGAGFSYARSGFCIPLDLPALPFLRYFWVGQLACASLLEALLASPGDRRQQHGEPGDLGHPDPCWQQQ